MKKILIFDNYDSFTYNLLHAVRSLGYTGTDVRLNNEISLEEVGRYDKIILSPGPGIPRESGILLPLVRKYASSKSILGVCLGHQAIGEAFGAKTVNLEQVFHGVASSVHVVKEDLLFNGMGRSFLAGRYHSWAVSREGFPDCLEITSEDGQGGIMSLRHKKYNVRGIQFHPESVLTPQGKIILENWLKE